ncbi:thiamine pyrophosphokinase [Saccharopolyspora sp. HNM0983]|uniref:Thiamine pyrophosphokinase n=1 Tax=Saccharopolyspora montiporae TaxID=2781240 RepID=A0A929BDA6_9PSEU|nr:putative cytokinetic ring protein SteA [Saccharopolyspora sp. HNM0983]MBE9375943.1 thiamine pyrophosphokinase [Saccharopolyspora sp. HNM0983]
MRLSGALTRQQEKLPGLVGTARVERRSGELPRRVRAGDIAVIDQTDLDRRTAEALLATGAAAVVNVAPSISGRYPNLGPEVLVSAGVVLVDGVGRDVLHRIKDGSRVRVHGGTVFAGERAIAEGNEQTADDVADQLVEAKAGMAAQLEAFSANTIEFLRRERALLLDGIGVPLLGETFQDRHVLVVAADFGHVDDLRRLRRYIAEYRPALLGVESGADVLREAGYTPDVIIADPTVPGPEALRCGAAVVVPAHSDGHAPGIERVRDLGVEATPFVASGNPEDLALLLADANGAELVVTVGFQATLGEFLDRGRSGSNPSTFLTRLRLGGKVVDAASLIALQRSRTPVSTVVLLVAAVFVVLLVAGLGAALLDMPAGAGAVFGGIFAGLVP